jgi:O-antigen ligase
MSLIGLWQYASGQNLITSEGGLMRLRSIYGSPNNVALYLGRIIPILTAYVLMGKGRRRSLYGLGLIVTTIALILTFSKGSLFLGLPLSLLVILIYWRRARGGNLWPWLAGFLTLAVVIFLGLFQIPQTAGRLNPQGVTGFLRLNLWKASYNMFRDHPIFGVGLDNFLYEYRGKYLLDAAWKEPNLSHPHNLMLDLATRLGIFGLASGVWLIWSYWSISFKLPNTSTPHWKPIAVGLVAVLFGLIAHGLVDHSLFLVDLSFVFFFLLGLCVWIKNFGTKSVTHPIVEG